MRSDSRTLLWQADLDGYAVPAFNYSDLWEMEAILEAAQEERAPVILATNAQVAQAHGIAYLAEQARIAIQLASIPAVNHLDHCCDPNCCREAIESGYPSVMIDLSHRPIEENIAITQQIVERAAVKGVAVEAEIGRIKGRCGENDYDGDEFLVDVASAVRMVKETGVDSLAIGIGNAHGFYRERPQINFERLAEVNEAVSIPLVLHGGTGIPQEDLQKAIRMGINKVNIGTQLHYRYVTSLREELARHPDRINVVDLMLPVKERIKADVRACIRMCMASGRA